MLRRLQNLILPNAEKMVWVTSMEGLDETLGSENHRDGRPRIVIVSGSRLPLEYPAKVQVQLFKHKFNLFWDNYT